MKSVSFAVLCATFLASLFLHADSAVAARRVLLIGDETVVDSIIQPDGFTNELRSFMKEEDRDVEFVPLGINRSTFEDWRALVANSYAENQPTDVEGVFIKEELDKGADLVIVFLGINDARKPTLRKLDHYAIDQHGVPSPEVGAQFRENVAGLVADLRARVPNCRVLTSDLWTGFGAGSTMISQIQDEISSPLIKTDWDRVVVNRFLAFADTCARFANEEISVGADDFRYSRYGAQLMTWGLLLALVPDRSYLETLDRAEKAYASQQNEKLEPNPPFDSWEELAKRYYETKIDSRLLDSTTSGFYLVAHYRIEREHKSSNSSAFAKAASLFFPPDHDETGDDDKIVATVSCQIRDQNANSFRKRELSDSATTNQSSLRDRPEIKVVSCGNLRFEPNESGSPTVNAGQYSNSLSFRGFRKDLPCNIVISVNGVQKTVRIYERSSFLVSGVFPLGQEFSSLEDYPKEKAVSSVDFAALTGREPHNVHFNPKPTYSGRESGFIDPNSPALQIRNPATSWQPRSSSPSQSFSREGAQKEPDQNWLNLANSEAAEPFAGVYVVRYFNSPKEQTGTLKLGVKGYRTHVVERVYLNAKQVFFGELSVGDPDKNEVSIPVSIHKGKNAMIARVDRTEWDWFVGFTLLDDEGRPLRDLAPTWR